MEALLHVSFAVGGTTYQGISIWFVSRNRIHDTLGAWATKKTPYSLAEETIMVFGVLS